MQFCSHALLRAYQTTVSTSQCLECRNKSYTDQISHSPKWCSVEYRRRPGRHVNINNPNMLICVPCIAQLTGNPNWCQELSLREEAVLALTWVEMSGNGLVQLWPDRAQKVVSRGRVLGTHTHQMTASNSSMNPISPSPHLPFTTILPLPPIFLFASSPVSIG